VKLWAKIKEDGGERSGFRQKSFCTFFGLVKLHEEDMYIISYQRVKKNTERGQKLQNTLLRFADICTYNCKAIKCQGERNEENGLE